MVFATLNFQTENQFLPIISVTSIPRCQLLENSDI